MKGQRRTKLMPLTKLHVTNKKDCRLYKNTLIFQEFQPMWLRYLNVTERRTNEQRGGQTDNLIATAIPRCAYSAVIIKYEPEKNVLGRLHGIPVIVELLGDDHRVLILAVSYLPRSAQCYTDRGIAMAGCLSVRLSVTLRYRGDTYVWILGK